MESIGIRELRQNASKYLRRVAAGESFTVTDRGNPVGELVPVQRDRRSTLEQKIARGEVVPPERPNAAVWETPPLPAAPGQALPSEVLQRMRDEERF